MPSKGIGRKKKVKETAADDRFWEAEGMKVATPGSVK